MSTKMAKPRKQTYTMDMYLRKIKEKDVCDNADVQRMAGAWKNGQINELIFTVLTEDYIPPVILGEEESSQLWIIDGLQRSSSLMRFRYGNYKVTSAVENSIISYRAKKRDRNGNVSEDKDGNVVWENAQFNIRNKTYDDLPDELKKRFNEYQIETVIHECCDMKRISTLIKRYNNHTSMNTAQKAFTHIDKFAKEIRKLINEDFFSKSRIFSERERTNGTVERVVQEAVMCMFHLDEWKTGAVSTAKYLNKNSCKEEFYKLGSNLQRLGKIISAEGVEDVFAAKDVFVWLAFYNRFVDLGFSDDRFAEFIISFKNGLRKKEVNGRVFDVVDKEGSTKDKAVISAKLQILETLLFDFLNINPNDSKERDLLLFVRNNVNQNIVQDDIELFEEVFYDLTLNTDNSSKLLENDNKPSFIAVVAYSFEQDIDLDDWIVDFFNHNDDYIKNQKENYIYMKKELEKYVA